MEFTNYELLERDHVRNSDYLTSKLNLYSTSSQVADNFKNIYFIIVHS
jgi:hypothetical protein